MSTRTVAVDFGSGTIDIDVPADSVVVEFEDPPLLKDPEAAVRQALAEPYDSAPLRERAKPGMTVAIGFDDITRPALPPQTILPIVVEELFACGINERDILFINASSNHRKNTPAELAAHLGPEIYARFGPLGQIINHDCTDQSELTYFGVTDGGRVVEMNRRFVEADLMIYQGNVFPQPFKAYTGTGVAIGLASTKSIASHHSFHAIPSPSKKKSSVTDRAKRSVKVEMTEYLDAALGREVFYINAVTGIGGKLAGVYAGSAKGVKPPAWEFADKIFNKPVPQADVMIVGIPESYSYGNADDTLIAAVGACVPPRFSPKAPVLREGGVVIAMTCSRGVVNTETHPSYQDVIDLYGRYFSVRDMVDHEDEFNNRADYRHKYTHGFAYPPLHGFWIIYELESTLQRASSVIMAGVPNPEPFRTLGLQVARDFEAAWKMALKTVGKDPVTVVAPTFHTKPKIKFCVDE